MRKGLKVILVHGNGGATAKIHWFPWLKKELTALGIKTIARNFPDPILAREKIWLPFLKDILKADDKTVIVGHSSGAVATMRFAEKNKIHGSVLVGACHTDLGDKNEKKSGYYNHPWNWKTIRNKQNWLIQFHSLDDPYIPVSEARYIHRKLHTEYFEFENRKHFGGEGKDDQKQFPELLKALKTKLL